MSLGGANAMRTFAAAVMCVVLATQNDIWAQSPDDKSADPILSEYRSRLPMLIERYSTNRKIRFRIIRYVVDEKPGQRVGEVSFSGVGEAVTDGQQIKVVPLESKPERPNEVAHFWRHDMLFEIARKANAYKIADQHLASGNYFTHESDKYPLNVHSPMLSGGGAGTSLWFDDRGQKYVLTTVVGVKPATWKGRECIEVRSQWDNRHGLVELASTYLDSDHDYITIGGETDWKAEFGTKKESKSFMEIEYTPSAEGFPLPKFVRRTLQFRDGITRKVSDVEFLSYERYVPSPEEFQLEKPYGLTTPAVVPTTENKALTPPAAQRRIWPWLVIGAGAVLAVVSVVFIRRSRKQEAAPAAPVAKSS